MSNATTQREISEPGERFPRLCLFSAGILLLVLVAAGLRPTAAAESGSLPDADNGRRLYGQFCAPCHGTKGDGRGLRTHKELLRPPPRDHSNGHYMNKQSDITFFGVIKFGGKANDLTHLMPPWRHILADSEIRDLVAHLRTLADPPWNPAGTRKWELDPFSDQAVEPTGPRDATPP